MLHKAAAQADMQAQQGLRNLSTSQLGQAQQGYRTS